MCAIVCVCDCTRVCQHCCVYVRLLTICFQAFPSIVQLWLTLERSGKQTALRARVAASWTHGGFLKLKLVGLAQCQLLLRSKWLDTKMIKHVVLPKKMLIHCMSQKGFWVLPVGKHSIPRDGSINICLRFAPFLRNDELLVQLYFKIIFKYTEIVSSCIPTFSNFSLTLVLRSIKLARNRSGMISNAQNIFLLLYVLRFAHLLVQTRHFHFSFFAFGVLRVLLFFKRQWSWCSWWGCTLLLRVLAGWHDCIAGTSCTALLIFSKGSRMLPLKGTCGVMREFKLYFFLE